MALATQAQREGRLIIPLKMTYPGGGDQLMEECPQPSQNPSVNHNTDWADGGGSLGIREDSRCRMDDAQSENCATSASYGDQTCGETTPTDENVNLMEDVHVQPDATNGRGVSEYPNLYLGLSHSL